MSKRIYLEFPEPSCPCGAPSDWEARLAAVEKERDEANQAYHDLANEAQQKYAKYQANLNEARVVVDKVVTWDNLTSGFGSNYEIALAWDGFVDALAAMKAPKCGKCGGRGMVPKYHICPLCEGEIVSCEWKTKANVIAGGWWVYSCGNCDETFAEEDNSILISCPECDQGKESGE